MQNSTEPGLNVCLINLATFYNNKYRAKIARDREEFSEKWNNYMKVAGCLPVFDSVLVVGVEDLANRWSDMIHLFSKASYRSREGFYLLGGYFHPPKSIPL